MYIVHNYVFVLCIYNFVVICLLIFDYIDVCMYIFAFLGIGEVKKTLIRHLALGDNYILLNWYMIYETFYSANVSYEPPTSPPPSPFMKAFITINPAFTCTFFMIVWVKIFSLIKYSVIHHKMNLLYWFFWTLLLRLSPPQNKAHSNFLPFPTLVTPPPPFSQQTKLANILPTRCNLRRCVNHLNLALSPTSFPINFQARGDLYRLLCSFARPYVRAV